MEPALSLGAIEPHRASVALERNRGSVEPTPVHMGTNAVYAYFLH